MPLQTYNQYFSPPQTADPANMLVEAEQIKLARDQNAMNQERLGMAQNVFARQKQEWNQADREAALGVVGPYLLDVNTTDPQTFVQDMNKAGPAMAADLHAHFGDRAEELAGYTQTLLQDINTNPDNVPAAMRLVQTYQQQFAMANRAKNLEQAVLNGQLSVEDYRRMKFQGWKPQSQAEAEAVRAAGIRPQRPWAPSTLATDEGVLIIDRNTGTARRISAPEDGGPDNSPVYPRTPAAFKLRRSFYNNTLSSIGRINEVYSTGLTGPVAGRGQRIGSRFFSNPEFARLRARVGQLRTIIYGISGKQINESELDWLKNEILPGLEQPDENFQVALEELEDWTNRSKAADEEEYPALRSGGKEADKSEKQPRSPKTISDGAVIYPPVGSPPGTLPKIRRNGEWVDYHGK